MPRTSTLLIATLAVLAIVSTLVFPRDALATFIYQGGSGNMIFQECEGPCEIFDHQWFDQDLQDVVNGIVPVNSLQAAIPPKVEQNLLPGDRDIVMDASAESFEWDDTNGDSESSYSLQHVTLSVTHDVPFTLTGSADLVLGAFAWIELVDTSVGGVVLFEDSWTDDAGLQNIDAAGMLLAGRVYRLQAQVSSSATTQDAIDAGTESYLERASYEILLNVPEPGTGLFIGLGVALAFARRRRP